MKTSRALLMRSCSRPSPGTLGWLAALFSVLGLACEEKKAAPDAATLGRSDAVLAPSGSSTPVLNSKAAAAPAAQAAAPRQALCDARPGTEFPSAKLEMVRSGGGAMGESSPLRGLTWVNLWAAWCEPCKKEMPLIVEFQERLRKEGLAVSIAFVSLDDDERQLDQFLAKNPKLSSTFWLREGKGRESWLKEAGLGADPRLPVHVLVDGSGKAFCRIEGSIEPDDYALVAAEFGKAG